MAARPIEDNRGGVSPFHQHRISEPFLSVTDSPVKMQDIGSPATYALPLIV